MPHYFFHLRDGVDSLIDEEGVSLTGIDAARASAVAQARDLISHEALEGKINLAQQIDVFDEEGLLVCSVKFEDVVKIRP